VRGDRDVRYRLFSPVFLVACGGGGGFPDARPYVAPSAPGAFSIAWSLAGPNGNTTCAQAAATTVRVGILDEITAAQYSATFDCALGLAASGALLPSRYDLTFTLLGVSGAISNAPAQDAIDVASGRTTRLAPVVFAVP
jgi:hypothetical protein